MKVPAGNIPLREAFDRYFQRRWHDGFVHSALEHLRTTERQLSERKSHLSLRRRKSRADQRRLLGAQRRTDIAVVEFRRAFERGHLEARAWDPTQSREVTLTPSLWKAAFYAERLFLADAVPDFFRADKALADYVELQFYVEKGAFEEWLAKQADSAASTIEKQMQARKAQTSATPSKAAIHGRPMGSGSYLHEDSALVVKALQLIDQCPGLSAIGAVRLLPDQLPGVGSVESRAKRIARKVRKAPTGNSLP
jgi:hypothetical protein